MIRAIGRTGEVLFRLVGSAVDEVEVRPEMVQFAEETRQKMTEVLSTEEAAAEGGKIRGNSEDRVMSGDS